MVIEMLREIHALVRETRMVFFIYIITKKGLRFKIGSCGCLGAEYWWWT